jgi:hypothetical protein
MAKVLVVTRLQTGQQNSKRKLLALQAKRVSANLIRNDPPHTPERAKAADIVLFYSYSVFRTAPPVDPGPGLERGV